MTGEQFVDTADAKKTDREIMTAILWAANMNTVRAKRIWENPSYAEALDIWEIVTEQGKRPSTDFCWGAAGSRWAKQFGLDG